MVKITHDIGIISGFSGVGKGTICTLLKNQMVNGKPVRIIRSVTTRPPRSEDDPYYFVGKKTFQDLIARNMLLEYNDSFASNCYGTPIWEIQCAIQQGEYPVLEIDPVGYAKILASGNVDPNHIQSVFLCADPLDVAIRLYMRGTEKETTIQKRLKTSLQEIQSIMHYKAVVENKQDDASHTLEQVLAAFEGKQILSDFDTESFQHQMESFLQTFERNPGKNEIPSEDDYFSRERIVMDQWFSETQTLIREIDCCLERTIAKIEQHLDAEQMLCSSET